MAPLNQGPVTDHWAEPSVIPQDLHKGVLEMPRMHLPFGIASGNDCQLRVMQRIALTNDLLHDPPLSTLYSVFKLADFFLKHSPFVALDHVSSNLKFD